MRGRALLFLAATAALSSASYFETAIHTNTIKCYNEDLIANTLFVAEVEPKGGVPIKTTVTLQGETEVYLDETSNSTIMKTAFTAPKTTRVNVCIQKVPKHHKQAATVGVRILSGTMAKDFTGIARKDELDPVLKDLILTEEMLKEYAERQARMVVSDKLSQQVVDRTFNTVIRMAIISIGLLAVGNVAITVYLRQYFRQKKII